MPIWQVKMVKIAVIGPESTGKTYLAKHLADMFRTNYVPEYARPYLDQINRKYTESDLLEIAKGQKRSEDQILKQLNRDILFMDTDLIVLKIWSDVKYGRCHPWIQQQIESDKYDLYLLTYPDLPWKGDPQREYPAASDRIRLFKLYEQELRSRKFQYVVIQGQKDERVNNAMAAILKHCPEQQA
jgi:NadR type nicotinamide-nucleotide adenylyltransferase